MKTKRGGALAANAAHGHRRTNADKRRAVEVALREFPKLSDRAVAEMCGVSHNFVSTVHPQLSSNDSSPRLGRDGKVRKPPERPAPRSTEPAEGGVR